MPTPKRFSSGVTNVGSSDALGQFLAPAPTKVHIDFDDFNIYTTGDWTTTTTANNTIAMTDGDGGQLLLSCSKADNSIVHIERPAEVFALEAGKKAWFGARIKLSAVTQVDVLTGLQVSDGSPIAGAPSDGVYFRKDDGDTNIDFQIMAGSVSVATVNAIATITTSFMNLEWYFDGKSTFEYYVDGVLGGSLSTASFPTTEMSIGCAIQQGDNVSVRTLTVDWLYAAKER